MDRELIHLKKYVVSNISTIGDKTVETLYSDRVTSEKEKFHTPPLPPPFKVGIFVFFYLTVAQHCMEGMGEEKLYFALLKPSLGRSFSTHFVSKCLNRNLRAVVLLVPVKRH